MHKDFAHRLHALATPGRKPIRAEFNQAGGDDKVAIFRLYDPIDSWGGDWGISAKELATALDELPDSVEEIRLHINSPGGEVFEGIAILNTLRSHKARVVAVVDGIAASAASFIACGADEVAMAKNSELMIHDAWGLCVGNAEDMRKLADELDHLSNNIASIYADKAGGTTDEWRAAMADETWYSAEEAVTAGLADRVEAKAAPDAAKARFDLSIFTYAGRKAAPDPVVNSDEKPNPSTDPETAPAAQAAAPSPAEADGEDMELLARSLEHLISA